MLERCIACGRDEFADRVWGRQPLLSRAAQLPRDFSDLLSPAMVDEIIAERGVRTPFVRMAREGALLDRACFTRAGGFGAQMPAQIDPRRRAHAVRRRGDDRSAGPASILAAGY